MCKIIVRRTTGTSFPKWMVFVEIGPQPFPLIFAITTFSFKRSLSLVRALLDPNNIQQYINMRLKEVSYRGTSQPSS